MPDKEIMEAVQCEETIHSEGADAPAVKNSLKVNPWRRLLAWCVDILIVSAAYYITSGFWKMMLGAYYSVPVFFFYTGRTVTYYIFRKIYFISATWGAGGSPGKKLMKIRVVAVETGETPEFWRCAFRETVGKYLSFVSLGIGYIMASGSGRALHDRLADTAVIYDTSEDV